MSMKKLAAIAVLFIVSITLAGTIWYSNPLGMDLSADGVLLPAKPVDQDIAAVVWTYVKSRMLPSETPANIPYPYMSPGKQTTVRLASGYSMLSYDDQDRYRISSIVSVKHRKNTVLLSAIFPFQIVDNGDGGSSYGIDDLFLTLRVNPPGIRWSLFEFGIRFSRPVAMLFMTHENTFTTEYVGNNMDFTLGLSGYRDTGIGRFESGVNWIYSTRLSPDEDTWYDYISPGSLFLLSASWRNSINDSYTLEADATAFLRNDSKAIILLESDIEDEENIDDSQKGILIHTSFSADKLPLRPSLHVQTCIPVENSVYSLSFLLGLTIRDTESKS